MTYQMHQAPKSFHQKYLQTATKTGLNVWFTSGNLPYTYGANFLFINNYIACIRENSINKLKYAELMCQVYYTPGIDQALVLCFAI